MTAVRINRLPTGIPGLDQVLGGGIPEYSFNLIAGLPGCGKTSLAHQLMFGLATPERPALYFTVLGEPPLKMLRYQQQYEFFDASRIGESINFVNLGEEVLSGDLGRVLDRILAEVKARAPALVFVDSFRSVLLSASKDGAGNGVAQFVQHLGMLMTGWQATTILIGDYGDGADAHPIFTVADGVILLCQSVERNSVVRKLQVLKMRGQATLPGLHCFRMGAGGIEVFAALQEPTFADWIDQRSGWDDGSPQRLSMGVPHLDEMLGGGLPRGYSVLVAGPSGSGKSILAETFLFEGARLGEAGVMVAFEQRPNQQRSPRLTALINSGKVSLLDSGPSDLGREEVAHRLVAEIGRLDARRVVIDSLSGFELALAPTFREDFRESLLRMVKVLAAAGVTVLMTSELEDRYTDLRFSPYGAAFLTDAIIVQRYIEVGSRLRRVMAVVKVRASRHSDALREYEIDDQGIRIGAMLPQQEGLLGGRPTTRDRDLPGADAGGGDHG
jgi:circadian clock protein KaiC